MSIRLVDYALCVGCHHNLGDTDDPAICPNCGSVDLYRPQAARVDRVGDDWRAWVPPRGDQDFEGDAIVAPYGDSFWSTWNDACVFVYRVTRGLL